jgi:hypothetical protein
MPCAIWNSLFVPIALAATISLAGVAHAQGRPHSAPPFSGPSSPTAVPATNRTDPERAAKDRCPNGSAQPTSPSMEEPLPTGAAPCR